MKGCMETRKVCMYESYEMAHFALYLKSERHDDDDGDIYVCT